MEPEQYKSAFADLERSAHELNALLKENIDALRIINIGNPVRPALIIDSLTNLYMDSDDKYPVAAMLQFNDPSIELAINQLNRQKDIFKKHSFRFREWCDNKPKSHGSNPDKTALPHDAAYSDLLNSEFFRKSPRLPTEFGIELRNLGLSELYLTRAYAPITIRTDLKKLTWHYVYSQKRTKKLDIDAVIALAYLKLGDALGQRVEDYIHEYCQETPYFVRHTQIEPHLSAQLVFHDRRHRMRAPRVLVVQSDNDIIIKERGFDLQKFKQAKKNFLHIYKPLAFCPLGEPFLDIYFPRDK